VRLLITGASGFIGKNLLLGLPKDVSIVGTYHTSEKEFLEFIEINKLKNVKPMRFATNDDVKRICDYCQFDVCIYLAGNSDPTLSEANPIYDIENNILPLLKLLGRLKTDGLIYFSSGAVYDRRTGPVNPDWRISPKLPYAVSKMAGEQYIKHFQYKNLNSAIIVRFFGAYGPYESDRKIYSRLAWQFGIEKNPKFIIRGDGKNLIDAMWIDDAVGIIRELIDMDTGLPSIKTIDLYAGQPMTINRLVERAGKIFHVEPEITYEGKAAEHNQFYSNDIKFKFKPAISLEKGLVKLKEWLEVR